MKINDALRAHLESLLPANYRREIVERLKLKGITVHPNTVSNALAGADNPKVVLELLELANEMMQSQKQFDLLVMQLSTSDSSQTALQEPGANECTIKTV